MLGLEVVLLFFTYGGVMTEGLVLTHMQDQTATLRPKDAFISK